MSWKSLAPVALGCLIVLKLVLGSFFVYRMEYAPSPFDGHAMASDERASLSGENGQAQGNPEEEEPLSLELLRQMKAALEGQEDTLKKEKAVLLGIRKEINEKLDRLTRLRDEIKAELKAETELKAAKEAEKEKRKAQEKAEKAQRLRLLKKAYSSMKPQKAAGLMEKLELGFAIELLSEMKGDAVGQILSFVDMERAAKISEGLANLP